MRDPLQEPPLLGEQLPAKLVQALRNVVGCVCHVAASARCSWGGTATAPRVLRGRGSSAHRDRTARRVATERGETKFDAAVLGPRRCETSRYPPRGFRS